MSKEVHDNKMEIIKKGSKANEKSETKENI